MKKLFIVLLIALFTASFVYAEQSAQTYSGNSLQRYPEQQVFIDCYNNSGSDISSNWVVILDTSTSTTASGTTLGTYITTTTTANDTRVLGVTDAVISNGKVGRVCVRGPHKVFLGTLGGPTVGATLATTTTAGQGNMSSSTTKGGNFGILLVTSQTQDATVAGLTPVTEPASLYWAWIGNVGTN